MAWSPDDNTLEHVARFGYGARGLVYCLVGVLALLAAVGGGGAEDSEGALRFVLAGPLGAVLVAGIALGLAGFALWRGLEGAIDADRRGRGAQALVVRGAHLVSAGVYGSLAVTAVGLALGLVVSGGDGVRDGTAWLLDQPFGPWLVGLAGLAVAGTGIGYAAKAAGGDVTKRLALPERAAGWARALGRFGYAARGLVFLIIGGFVLTAAWTQSSAQAEGLSGAFAALRRQPFGAALLGVVALGHLAFGAFGLVQARYRRIEAPDIEATDGAVARVARVLT